MKTYSGGGSTVVVSYKRSWLAVQRTPSSMLPFYHSPRPALCMCCCCTVLQKNDDGACKKDSSKPLAATADYVVLR